METCLCEIWTPSGDEGSDAAVRSEKVSKMLLCLETTPVWGHGSGEKDTLAFFVCRMPSVHHYYYFSVD